MIFVSVWLLMSIAAAIISEKRGNSPILGFVGGLILGPIAVIAALAEKPNKKIEKDVIKGNKRKCPFCAEIVKNEAFVCKHCGREIGKKSSSVISKDLNSL